MNLKLPPPWLLALTYVFAIAFIAGSICLVVLDISEWWSYIVYVAAACLLGYSVYTIVIVAPFIKPKIIELSKKTDFTDNLISDYAFRTSVFSMTSYVLNVVFVVFNIVISIITHAVWYAVMGVYYIALSVMRLIIFYFGRRARKLPDERKREICENAIMRNSGISLIVLAAGIGGGVVQVIIQGNPIAYGEIMAISTTVFAFAKIIFATYNFFKARKTNDPIVQSFRNINVTGALVSLLAAQVTLSSVYGGDSMNALHTVVGAVICLLSTAIGAYMIVRAVKRINIVKKSITEKGEGECQQIDSQPTKTI